MNPATNNQREAQRHIETYRLTWSGIEIEVRYEPHWLNIGPEEESDYDYAHIEVESLSPERAPLPFTDTGYRSHFTSPDFIARQGGPVAFVREWLDIEASTPEWRAKDAAARQGSLF